MSLRRFPRLPGTWESHLYKRIPSVRQLNLGVQDLVVVASRELMGTTKEWGEVLFTAILWSAGMLLFRRMGGKITKDVVLLYTLGALSFGLVTSFPLKRVFSCQRSSESVFF